MVEKTNKKLKNPEIHLPSLSEPLAESKPSKETDQVLTDINQQAKEVTQSTDVVSIISGKKSLRKQDVQYFLNNGSYEELLKLFPSKLRAGIVDSELTSELISHGLGEDLLNLSIKHPEIEHCFQSFTQFLQEFITQESDKKMVFDSLRTYLHKEFSEPLPKELLDTILESASNEIEVFLTEDMLKNIFSKFRDLDSTVISKLISEPFNFLPQVALFLPFYENGQNNFSLKELKFLLENSLLTYPESDLFAALISILSIFEGSETENFKELLSVFKDSIQGNWLWKNKNFQYNPAPDYIRQWQVSDREILTICDSEAIYKYTVENNIYMYMSDLSSENINKILENSVDYTKTLPIIFLNKGILPAEKNLALLKEEHQKLLIQYLDNDLLQYVDLNTLDFNLISYEDILSFLLKSSTKEIFIDKLSKEKIEEIIIIHAVESKNKERLAQLLSMFFEQGTPEKVGDNVEKGSSQLALKIITELGEDFFFKDSDTFLYFEGGNLGLDILNAVKNYEYKGTLISNLGNIMSSNAPNIDFAKDEYERLDAKDLIINGKLSREVVRILLKHPQLDLEAFQHLVDTGYLADIIEMYKAGSSSLLKIFESLDFNEAFIELIQGMTVNDIRIFTPKYIALIASKLESKTLDSLWQYILDLEIPEKMLDLWIIIKTNKEAFSKLKYKDTDFFAKILPLCSEHIGPPTITLKALSEALALASNLNGKKIIPELLKLTVWPIDYKGAVLTPMPNGAIEVRYSRSSELNKQEVLWELVSKNINSFTPNPFTVTGKGFEVMTKVFQNLNPKEVDFKKLIEFIVKDPMFENNPEDLDYLTAQDLLVIMLTVYENDPYLCYRLLVGEDAADRMKLELYSTQNNTSIFFQFADNVARKVIDLIIKSPELQTKEVKSRIKLYIGTFQDGPAKEDLLEIVSSHRIPRRFRQKK